jgi:hypothetical protein
MANAIGRHIDWLLAMQAGGMLRSAEDMAREPFGVAEASTRAPRPYEPEKDRESGRLQPDQVSWFELGNLMEHEPEQGRDLWYAIKAAARQKLATGVRAAYALESPLADGRNPWQ